MTPQERLKEIENNACDSIEWSWPDDPYYPAFSEKRCVWLIARVKQLELVVKTSIHLSSSGDGRAFIDRDLLLEAFNKDPLEK